MKVLLVSVCAPPQNSPRSMRVAALGAALRAAGHEVEVIHGDLGGDDTSLLDRLGEVRRHTLPLGPLNRARRKPPAVEGRAPVAGRVSPGWKAQARLFAFPDVEAEILASYLLVRPPVVRPDLVVSVVLPFSGAVLGHALARRFGVAHIIDYGDPWSYRAELRDHPWRASLDRRLEARIVSGTRGVVLTTDAQAEAMRRWFPRCSPVVFTNGFHPDDYPAGEAAEPGILRYVGQLYPERASMGPVLSALARSRAFERIETVGQVDHVALPASVAALPPVSFRDSLRLQRTAGAVLVLGVPGGLQIPSKFFHAVGSRRPVLVVAGEGDALLRFPPAMREQVVVVDNREEAILDGLERVRALADRDFEPPPECGWPVIGAAYVRYLESRI